MRPHPPYPSRKISSTRRAARPIIRLLAAISLVMWVSTLPVAALAPLLPAHPASPVEDSSAADQAFTPRPPALTPLPAYSVMDSSEGAQVCGEIGRDEVWTTAVGSYVVTCDVHVVAGSTLTIEPGVAVKFQNADTDLIVSGELIAIGSESAPIVFQPIAAFEPGSWGRVAFLPRSAGRLHHVTLEYGGREDGQLYLASENVQVLNSIVRYSADTGIVIQTGQPNSPIAAPAVRAATVAARQAVPPPVAPAAVPLTLTHNAFLPVICTKSIVDQPGPVIRHSQVLSNTGILGGGLYNEAGSPIIQDNTFAGNTANGAPWSNPGLGAGLYNESGSPMILDNAFTGNGLHGHYTFGGGLYNKSGSPLIEHNAFSGNVAGYRTSGGGLYNESGAPTVARNAFADNYAEQDGGGLLNESGSPLIGNNSFVTNTASGRTYSGHGGGLSSRAGSPLIEGNLFAGNEVGGIYGAGYGGGLFSSGPSVTIRSNVFRGNSSHGHGGGLHNSGPDAKIQNNVFSGNAAYYGGGVSNEWFDALIENNTLKGNQAAYTGGGFENLSGNPQIRNNVFASNSAQSGGGLYVGGGSPSADYNNVWNNSGGAYVGIAEGPHDLAADPLFMDAAANDYHLAAGSPCIDAGDPDHFPATDFEGDVRPQGTGPDIGADEYAVGRDRHPVLRSTPPQDAQAAKRRLQRRADQAVQARLPLRGGCACSARATNSSTPNKATLSPISTRGRSASFLKRTHDLPTSYRLPVAR